MSRNFNFVKMLNFAKSKFREIKFWYKTNDIYRFPRLLIVTSQLYVVPEADAKQLVAAPIRAKCKFVNIK
jgi:hypothetical protein